AAPPRASARESRADAPPPLDKPGSGLLESGTNLLTLMNPSAPPEPAEPSLEEILGRTETKLKKVLSRYRIPAQDADDLLQETFLIMVSKLATIRNPDAWVVATLANRCIIYWRRHRSR